MVQEISGVRRGPWRAARPWLLASAATLAALAAGRPALAAPICTPGGVPSAGATVTCVSDGAVATGITYAGGAPDMTLVLDGTTSGALTILSGTAPPTPQGAVTLVPNSAATPSRITTTGTVSITTTGNNNGGLFIDGSSAGASVGITVASGTTIDTSGTDAYGAYAGTFIGGNATVTASGGSITTGGDFSHALFAEAFTGGATVTIDGSTGTTTIVTSGIGAYGAYARSSGAAEALVSLAGDPATVTVTTTGSGSYGLHALNTGAGAARISISGGTISTSDSAARGAFAAALGAGAATVEISGGSITTLGSDAVGAMAETSTGVATVTQTGGAIVTTGSGAYGLSAQSTFGSAAVTAGGSVATSGAGAHGAYASALAGAATVTVSGLITTGGDGAHGAFAEAGASSAAIARVSMTGGSVTTGVDALGVPTLAGADASGLFARNLGTGVALVDVSGGTIITHGESSGGVLAGGAIAESAGGAAGVSVTGSITTHGFGAVAAGASGATEARVTLAGAGITTAGHDAQGAYATVTGSGAGDAMITIDSASTILTGGIDAHGAYAEVTGTGNGLVMSGGSVTTTGLGAAGLHVSALAGEAFILNIGSVATSGSFAPGLFAISGGPAGIIHSGSVTTTGGSAIGAFAISLAPSSAVASIIIYGSILTGGGGTATGAYGAYATLIGASSGLASVWLEEVGSITTTGLGGFAAFADSQTGGDAEVRNAGTITTQGDESRGAYARVALGMGNALVVNAGSVATAGALAHGLEAGIESGPNGHATGNATVINTGGVTTAGEGAYGISAHSVDGDAAVTHAGSIVTAGANAHGILIEASGTATVTSSGSVSASGAAASGIHIGAAAGGYGIAITGGTITGGSSFDASLGTGAGISVGGGASGTIEVAAGATVQAASGVAIQDGAGAMLLTSSGNILGSIVAGGGDDRVTLAAGSTTTGLADGGLGTDRITLAGARFTGSVTGWESFTITEGSHATLNGDIVMGDAATRTGNVTIDATSTLTAPGNYAIRAADAGSLVTLTNAGLIQIGSGSTAGNTLTIAGHYVGQGGSIALNTVLAGDGSASDRLVISGGRASGDTILRITNLGGAGAQTVQGIRVVETSNGGTTDAGAFRLNTRVVGGAFEYQLFRGGSTSAQDWYLRSFLIPETPVTPDQPGPAIPLYRPEVSLYAPVAAAARQMGLATLGTLQSRRSGEGEIPDAGGTLGKVGEAPGHAAWARVIGERSRSRWDGTVDARATGNLIGLQAGFDILQTQPYAGGHRDILGVYVAYTDFNAPSVSGFALGQQNLRVGRLLVSGPAAGAYWTHFGPSGWYVDAVVQVNWFDVSARSDFGTGLSTSGTGYAASLEAGYPIRLGGGWRVEPSAQLVWQGVSTDRSRDAFSTVDWDEGDAVTGRIGARLQYTGRDDRTLWQPYAKLNLWHAFSGHDRVSFGSGTPIESRFGETALEVGAGITARVNEAVSFYAHADYRWSVAGDSRQTAVQGSIGIRVTW